MATMLERRLPPIGAEPFLEQYDALKASLPGADVPWIAELRDAGRASFASLGLPTNKIEAWKYTSLRPLSRLSFAPVAKAEAGDAPRLLPAGSTAARIVFVNGRLHRELSQLDTLPAGVDVASLADALSAGPDLVEPHLGQIGGPGEQAMLALNTAMMADGLVLSIGRGVTVEKPIEIVFLTAAHDEPAASYPRNLIVAGPGSRATVIEQHSGPDGSYLVNGVTEIRVQEDATLHHYKVQEEGREAYHIFLNQVRIGRNGVYDSFVLSMGGRVARNQIDAIIDGPGAECLLNGAYMGRDRQHLDHTSTIDHAAPSARSRQVYHGALGDRARGVFQGQIVVRRPAQKTDGYQINRALLLSDGAEIDSKPNLEIYADDVKCSHGATVGDIDPDALFYLRARGIPEAEARGLLIAAFLSTVVDEMRIEEVRDVFRTRIEAWLSGAGERA